LKKLEAGRKKKEEAGSSNFIESLFPVHCHSW